MMKGGQIITWHMLSPTGSYGPTFDYLWCLWLYSTYVFVRAVLYNVLILITHTVCVWVQSFLAANSDDERMSDRRIREVVWLAVEGYVRF